MKPGGDGERSQRTRGAVEDPDEPTQLAKLYFEIGWSMIPIRRGTKEPVGGWKQAQRERSPLPDVLKWLNAGHCLAVVLGRVSDGWVCRDFDVESSYSRWAATNAELAKQLPTSKTARGYHVFARVDSESKIQKFDDGELRANGGFVLVPPSTHPTGIAYRWIRRPTLDSGPPLDVSQTGFVQASPYTTQTTETTQTTNGNVSSVLSPPTRDAVTPKELEEVEVAIRTTVPKGVGGRNDGVFRFARRVLAILEGRPSEELGERLALRWFEHARGSIGTLDPEVTLADFWLAIDRIRTPDHGQDPVSRAWVLSQDLPTPWFVSGRPKWMTALVP